MLCPALRCQGRVTQQIWVTAQGPAQPGSAGVSMGAHGPREGKVLGVPALSWVPRARSCPGPQPGDEGAENGCASTGKSSELNPTGGEALGTLGVPGARGVPDGDQSSTPQGDPGAMPSGLFLSWGPPGTFTGCWGCSQLTGCPVALGDGRDTLSPCRKCPPPESLGGCAVPWPRCSQHLRQGEALVTPGRMCGARLAQGLGDPGGPGPQGRGALNTPSPLPAAQPPGLT